MVTYTYYLDTWQGQLSEGFSQEVFQKFIGELYVSRIVDVIDMKGLKALEV